MTSTETLTAYRGAGAAIAAITIGIATIGLLGVGAARANRIGQVEQVPDFIGHYMAYGVYVTIAEDAGTELFVESVTGFVGLPKGFAATPFNRLTIPVTSENVSPFEQLIDEAIFFRQSGSLHIDLRRCKTNCSIPVDRVLEKETTLNAPIHFCMYNNC